jgi:hypothetical protein
MSIMAMIAGHTHFAQEGTVSIRLYTSETCDECGKTVYENGPVLHPPKSGSKKCWYHDTKDWLLASEKKALPEGADVDGLCAHQGSGKCVCRDCYTKLS